MSGFITIHRKIKNNSLWPKGELTELEAWLDVLMTVNWQDNRTRIGRKHFTCKRGESMQSYDTWAHQFKWSRSKVVRFFKDLQSEGMIDVLNTTRKTTHIRVCNYEDYQSDRNSNETQMVVNWSSNGRQMATTKQRNKETKKQKYSEPFEKFWEAYPSKGKPKRDTYATWKKMSLDFVADEIIEGLGPWLGYWLRDNNQFVTFPPKWLRNEMWLPENHPPPADRSQMTEAQRIEQSKIDLENYERKCRESNQRAIDRFKQEQSQ